jgi:sugar lactone lactonase YvrE
MRRQPSVVVASAVLGALFLTACGEGIVTPPCVASGTGNLTVTITGLPAGMTAAVSVTGPGGTTVLPGSSALTGLAGGLYTITSAPRAVADSTVSTYLRGAVPADGICLRDGESQTVTIPHSNIASAGKVWVGSDVASLAFTSNQLGATATLAPTVTAGTRGSAGAVFDRDGNLWVRGLSASDPYLMRYSAASLGSSGNPTPDRAINISSVNCEGSGAMAFDEGGNLWVSVGCQQRVLRLDAAQLAATGVVVPTIQITGLVRPEGLAFDAAGNLWVADDTHLRRFNAARLSANITTAADLRVTFTTPSPPSPGLTVLGVNHLAFSPTGELWVSTYTQFAVYRVEPAVVAATGAQTTQATRVLYFSTFAQPRGFAFDNSGGLLIAYFGSSFARLSPTQLQSSVLLPNTVTPAKVYVSGSIVAFAENVVMFPAPATTPLYSRAR